MLNGVQAVPVSERVYHLTGEWVAIETDELLISQALAGSQTAFRRLVDRYKKTVHHVALKVVRNEDTAQDITQETFMKAFAALQTYRAEYRFTTWLCRIAANTAIDHLRKRRLQELSFDRESESGDGFVEVEVPDWSFHPERLLEEKRRTKSIDEAIDNLPEPYRQVIIYRHKDDKSYEEIAELLQAPVGTVKARIFRARELLKKSLRELQ